MTSENRPENYGQLLDDVWSEGAPVWSWKGAQDKDGQPVKPFMTIDGVILSQERRQQTDPDTGLPKFWPDSRPQMAIVLLLQTEMHDSEEDDGKRRLFVNIPSGLYAATRQAIKAARLKTLAVGDKYAATWISTDKPTRKGINGQKQFAVIVESPSQNPPF